MMKQTDLDLIGLGLIYLLKFNCRVDQGIILTLRRDFILGLSIKIFWYSFKGINKGIMI